MSKKLNSAHSTIYNYLGFPQKRYNFIVNISSETLLFFLGVTVSISIEQFTNISGYVIDCSKISSIVCLGLKIIQLLSSIAINYDMYKMYRFSSRLHEYTLKTKLEEERDNKVFARLLLMSDVCDSDDTHEKVNKMSRKIKEITAFVIGMIVFGGIMIFAYIANGVVVNLL